LILFRKLYRRRRNIFSPCYTLPEEHGIDGVIGLNFLRHFKRFAVDFEQTLLTLSN